MERVTVRVQGCGPVGFARVATPCSLAQLRTEMDAQMQEALPKSYRFVSAGVQVTRQQEEGEDLPIGDAFIVPLADEPSAAHPVASCAAPSLLQQWVDAYSFMSREEQHEALSILAMRHPAAPASLSASPAAERCAAREQPEHERTGNSATGVTQAARKDSPPSRRSPRQTPPWSPAGKTAVPIPHGAAIERPRSSPRKKGVDFDRFRQGTIASTIHAMEAAAKNVAKVHHLRDVTVAPRGYGGAASINDFASGLRSGNAGSPKHLSPKSNRGIDPSATAPYYSSPLAGRGYAYASQHPPVYLEERDTVTGGAPAATYSPAREYRCWSGGRDGRGPPSSPSPPSPSSLARSPSQCSAGSLEQEPSPIAFGSGRPQRPEASRKGSSTTVVSAGAAGELIASVY